MNQAEMSLIIGVVPLCPRVLVFRPQAAFLEMLRCVVMVTLHRYGFVKPLLPLLAVPTEVRRPARNSSIINIKYLQRVIGKFMAYCDNELCSSCFMHVQLSSLNDYAESLKPITLVLFLLWEVKNVNVNEWSVFVKETIFDRV